LTTVTFLGGVNEIGGYCFSVEDGDTRLILDFGMRFSARRRHCEEYLKPRSAAGLLDVPSLGLVPNRLEFYRKELLEMRCFAAISRKPVENDSPWRSPFTWTARVLRALFPLLRISIPTVIVDVVAVLVIQVLSVAENQELLQQANNVVIENLIEFIIHPTMRHEGRIAP